MQPGSSPGGRDYSVDPSQYRKAVGRFATGITVVTTHLGDADFAITANSFTSVSLDPVLVLVCVDKTARFHPAVLAAGSWAVSILAVGQEDVSSWFATRGRNTDRNQFAGFACQPGPITGAMLFDHALAGLECYTVAAHDAGDHTVVIGEVVGMVLPPGPVDPLLYLDGCYRQLTCD